MLCMNTEDWKRATDEEIKNLHHNNTWKLVPLTPGMHIVKMMFIFKLKVQANSTVKRYKAHFIAKGFTQTWNVDYHETFTPIISIENFQLLLTFVVTCHNLGIQMDVEVAFLHAPLMEVVYVTQPEGYVDPE